MEKERQPGTAKFGNFINYYSFNAPNKRIELLKRETLFACVKPTEDGAIFILDIGCNAGVSVIIMPKPKYNLH